MLRTPKDSQYLDCGEFSYPRESDLNRQMPPPIQIENGVDNLGSVCLKKPLLYVNFARQSQTPNIHLLLFDLLSYSVDETGFPRARVASDC